MAEVAKGVWLFYVFWRQSQQKEVEDDSKCPALSTLNPKLEIISTSEAGVSKAELRWKLGLLYETATLNAKEEFVKEI